MIAFYDVCMCKTVYEEGRTVNNISPVNPIHYDARQRSIPGSGHACYCICVPPEIKGKVLCHDIPSRNCIVHNMIPSGRK